ncbi:hypothetical protein NITHO_4490005 [Nitrolancea hollandica Lb]|uniref:Uncharacterized protein n=1 Tax=Nitrolancea hollandica Lb TaxID=1129897 RepID=I4EKA1_9BACT|nr:hypothetical protein NITHO_4490005 [Nitrolancea hollandica Lb]
MLSNKARIVQANLAAMQSVGGR